MFLLCQRFSSFFNLRRLEGAWATHDLESTHISATSLGHNPSQVTLSLLVYQSEQQHSYLIAGDWENKSTKMDMLRYYSDSLNGFWENIPKLLSDLCKAYLNSSSLSLFCPLLGYKEMQLSFLLPALPYSTYHNFFQRNQNKMMLLKNKKALSQAKGRYGMRKSTNGTGRARIWAFDINNAKKNSFLVIGF